MLRQPGPVRRRPPRREQRPQEHPEPVDVGLGGDRLAARLLGRHVAGRALDAADRRVRRAPEDLADAEPGEPHVALDRDQHRLGAEVPVDDRRRVAVLVRGRVRVGEGARDARADVEDGRVAELLLLLGDVLHEVREASSPRRARAPARACPGAEEVEDADHRRVVEPRADGRLARQLLGEVAVAVRGVGHELELALAREAHRPLAAREVHLRRTRAAEAPDDLVRPDGVGDGLRRKHPWGSYRAPGPAPNYRDHPAVSHTSSHPRALRPPLTPLKRAGLARLKRPEERTGRPPTPRR